VIYLCNSNSNFFLPGAQYLNVMQLKSCVVKSRRMRWAGHVACMGEGRGMPRVLVG
jgi:hypothetical protein